MYTVSVEEGNLIDTDDKITYKLPTKSENQKSSQKCNHHRDDESDDDEDKFGGVNVNSINPSIESYIGKNIPILILITIKLLSQHITGFLILIACLVGSRASNNKVRLYDRRTVDSSSTVKTEALSIICLMIINLYLLFIVIEKEDGGKNVLFFIPVIETMSDRLLTIIWLIVLSQFWVQFLEITLKAIVAAILPISFHRKGFVYCFIQNGLTLYRWLLPMPQICTYLWSTQQHTTITTHSWYASLFDLLLILVYLVVKFLRIKDYVIGAYKSLLAILSSKEICERVAAESVVNDICPISHVPFSRTERGDKPVRIKNVSQKTHVVSEKALYCWLNLTSQDTKTLKCPVSLEDLVYSNGENTHGVYRAGTSTSYHIFLM